ncbi:outer membrane beta-barrel protein [Mariniflexile gromovii]|uniref:Outer membrane beta-barrel protein n=1 Tax=Mariniflexile gromovii TaxID=362523 RepID=A0ABS4BSR1_9FLAO|nr:outer membrane beta-barrel protein [Mariniflexile gromovii]MBP0903592.1 outer membrane beta-barrel protein [Mariniflexile gromovii]
MKTHLIIALVLVSTFTFAQNSEEKFEIPKNQWIVGGIINFNSQNSESEYESSNSDSNQTSLFIKPDIGYAIDSNLVIGLMPGFNILNFKHDGSNDEYKSNGFSIAPYIRKYFAISNNFALNVQGEFMYSYQKNENIYANSGTNFTSESDRNSIFIGVKPGLTYSLTNKIYLNANLGSIGYYSDKSENNEGIVSKSNNFNLSLSSSDLYFGVLVLL